MRFKRYKNGDTRVRVVFTWFPLGFNDTWYWMERVTLYETYWQFPVSSIWRIESVNAPPFDVEAAIAAIVPGTGKSMDEIRREGSYE